MDIEEVLHNAVAAKRAEEMKTSPQLTVGELILLLEPIVARQEEIKKKYDDEADVRFDFEYAFPTRLNSWRGRYAELAFEFAFPEWKADKQGYTQAPSVSEVLKMLKECIGKEYTGYKGGEFVMGKSTPVWVANYGNSGNTAIVGVKDEEYMVVLQTAYLSDSY